MKLKDARLLLPVIQQSIRHEAVEFFSKGFSKVHKAKLLCVSRKSIYKWVKAHSKSGSKGLQIQKQGRPKGTQLQSWQSVQIVNLIKELLPRSIVNVFFLMDP